MYDDSAFKKTGHHMISFFIQFTLCIHLTLCVSRNNQLKIFPLKCPFFVLAAICRHLMSPINGCVLAYHDKTLQLLRRQTSYVRKSRLMKHSIDYCVTMQQYKIAFCIGLFTFYNQKGRYFSFQCYYSLLLYDYVTKN